tara:strand:+ start:321 stop:758 length:438 start_codon:yes stop_codon:yes gene_type:complete
MGAVGAEALRWCVDSFASPIPRDDIGWQSLAEVHALDDVEIEQLMCCRVVRVDEQWQIELLASQLRSADTGCEATRLMRLLCMLVRAEMTTGGVSTAALDDVTLRIALREESDVSLVMASCVRLARVLACKLDAVSGLAQICENV